MFNIILILLIILIIFSNCRESFANKAEKAQVNHAWFIKITNPSYADYRAAVPDANIVDYEDLMKLRQDGNMNLNNILQVI